jgi:hypothetical protein
MIRRIVALLICFSLIFDQAGFAQVAPQLVIPSYLSNLAPVADRFRPVQLRSIEFDLARNNFKLLLDKGDLKTLSPAQTEESSQKLFQYFQIGLALPNSMFWVNLRPDSPENVIDSYLGKTDLGKVLLEADLQLKKDLARFTNPDIVEGRQYWDKLYAKAEQIFGPDDIDIPTLTRPWIVPGEIIIRESPAGAFIYKATLKVMLEQDYIKDSQFFSFDDPRLKEINQYSSELIRQQILPKLAREVNSSKRYAALRQVYYSLILAQWFKSKNKGSTGIDQKDLNGLTSKDQWSKATYYNSYKKSFSEGEYKKEETVNNQSGMTVRQYFSGGVAMMEGGSQTSVPAYLLDSLKAAGDFFEWTMPIDGTVRQTTEQKFSVEELDRLAQERAVDEETLGKSVVEARKKDPVGTFIVVIAGVISSGKTGVKERLTARLKKELKENVVFLDSERFLIPQQQRNQLLSYPRLKFDVDDHNRVLADLKGGKPVLLRFTNRNTREHVMLTPQELQLCRLLSEEEVRLGQHSLSLLNENILQQDFSGYKAKAQSRLWFDLTNGEVYEEIVPQKETFLVISDMALFEKYKEKPFDYSCFVWTPVEIRRENFVRAWRNKDQYADRFDDEAAAAKGFDDLIEDDKVLKNGIPFADMIVAPNPTPILLAEQEDSSVTANDAATAQQDGGIGRASKYRGRRHNLLGRSEHIPRDEMEASVEEAVGILKIYDLLPRDYDTSQDLLEMPDRKLNYWYKAFKKDLLSLEDMQDMAKANGMWKPRLKSLTLRELLFLYEDFKKAPFAVTTQPASERSILGKRLAHYLVLGGFIIMLLSGLAPLVSAADIHYLPDSDNASLDVSHQYQDHPPGDIVSESPPVSTNNSFAIDFANIFTNFTVGNIHKEYADALIDLPRAGVERQQTELMVNDGELTPDALVKFDTKIQQAKDAKSRYEANSEGKDIVLDGLINAELQAGTYPNESPVLRLSYSKDMYYRSAACTLKLGNRDYSSYNTLEFWVRDETASNNIVVRIFDGQKYFDVPVRSIGTQWQKVSIPLTPENSDFKNVSKVTIKFTENNGIESYEGVLDIRDMALVQDITEMDPIMKNNLGQLLENKNELDQALGKYRQKYGEDFPWNTSSYYERGPKEIDSEAIADLFNAYSRNASVSMMRGDVGKFMMEADVQQLIPQDPSFNKQKVSWTEAFGNSMYSSSTYNINDILDMNEPLESALVAYENKYNRTYYQDLDQIGSRVHGRHWQFIQSDMATAPYEENRYMYGDQALEDVISKQQYGDLQNLARLHIDFNKLFLYRYSTNDLKKFSNAGYHLGRLMPAHYEGDLENQFQGWIAGIPVKQQILGITYYAPQGDMVAPIEALALPSIVGALASYFVYLGSRYIIRTAFRRMDEKKLSERLGVSIIIARYIKNNNSKITKLINNTFRQNVNYLISMFGKEQTANRLERRVDADAKLIVLDCLFTRSDLAQEREVFDQFFKNNPDKYRLNDKMLQEIKASGLLGYISLKDLRYLTKAINEDPRKTVSTTMENIEQKVNERFSSPGDRQRVLNNLEWLIWNFYVLGRSFAALTILTKEQNVNEQNLVVILEELNKANTYQGISDLAQRYGIGTSALMTTKFGIMPWFETCTLIQSILQGMPRMQDFEREQNLGLLLAAIEELNSLSRMQLLLLLAKEIQIPGADGVEDFYILNKILDSPQEATITELLVSSRVKEDFGKEALAIMIILARKLPDAQREEIKTIVSSSTIEDGKKSVLIDACISAIEPGNGKGKANANGSKRPNIDNILKDKKSLADTWQAVRDLGAWIKESIEQVTDYQIPHVYLDSLLRLTRMHDGLYDRETLGLFKQFITTKKNRDLDADTKNAFFDTLQSFAQLNISDIPYQGAINRNNILKGALRYLLDKETKPVDLGDLDPLSVDTLRVMMKNLYNVLDIYRKAQKGDLAFFDKDGSGENKILILSESILKDIIASPDVQGKSPKPAFSKEKYNALQELLKIYIPQDLMATFSGVSGIDTANAEPLIVEYIHSDEFTRKDYEGNDIFKIIKIYLGNKSRQINKDIYQLMWKGIVAQMQGKFPEHKYGSLDYRTILDRIARTLLTKEQKETLLSESQENLLGRMQKDPLYASQVEIIEKIDALWRTDLKFNCTIKGELYSTEVVSGLFDLLTIGDSRYFSSCQRTSGGSLNKGLMSYVHNGTVKAVLLRNSKGEVVTRRIIRLLIAEDEAGNVKPVILAEENSQFNSKGIEEIYGALQVLSALMSAQGAGEIPVLKPRRTTGKPMKVFMPKGQAPFTYSDTFGMISRKQKSDLWKTIKVLEMPPDKDPDTIKEQFGFRQIVDGKTIGSLFDLRWREFDSRSSMEDILQAEDEAEEMDTPMIKVVGPSQEQVRALLDQGYFLKPSKINYEMVLPQATANVVMDLYYERFVSKRRSQYKKDVAAIEEKLRSGEYEFIEDTGATDEYINRFVEFYKEKMAAKERGRPALVAAIEKGYNNNALEFIRDDHLGLYLIDKKTNKMLGGVIAKKFKDRYSISYEATVTNRDMAATNEKCLRNLSFYFLQDMIKRSAAKGWTRLGAGRDTNLYGHHLTSGLMQGKVRVGFMPKLVDKQRELIKIVNYDNFNLPVFFFSLGLKGGLESTLIIGKDMEDQVDGFKKIADKLNVYMVDTEGALKQQVSNPQTAAQDGGEVQEFLKNNFNAVIVQIWADGAVADVQKTWALLRSEDNGLVSGRSREFARKVVSLLPSIKALPEQEATDAMINLLEGKDLNAVRTQTYIFVTLQGEIQGAMRMQRDADAPISRLDDLGVVSCMERNGIGSRLMDVFFEKTTQQKSERVVIGALRDAVIIYEVYFSKKGLIPGIDYNFYFPVSKYGNIIHIPPHGIEKISKVISQKQKSDGGIPQSPDQIDGAEQSAAQKETGGIDLRSLPVSIQNARNEMQAQLVKTAAASDIKDLALAWSQIEKEMKTNSMPYARIKEYIAVCSQRPDGKRNLSCAIICIMNIMKIEEEQALATQPELKDVLMCLG